MFGTALKESKNIEPTSAPVGYPHLWNTPFFDWVQWNGSIQQPMARNIAEALGVNTPITLTGDTADIFKSDVNIKNLHQMEKTLEKLEPPKWPEEILGRIDHDKATRGKALYEQRCAACHESKPYPKDKYGKEFLHIIMSPIEKIGTDPTDAENFHKRIVHTGSLSKLPFNLPPILSAPDALKAVTTQVAKRKYAELDIPSDQQDEMNGSRDNEWRARLEYRARNMNGIWATPPYLHNNSVRTLYQLLLPASQRETEFYVGTLEYDTHELGFKNVKVPDSFFEFRTGIKGNYNTGHEFRDAPGQKGVIGPLLKEEERWAIIEYLKTR